MSIYSNIISSNKNINFTILCTQLEEISKKFDFENVILKKNPFKQINIFNKILSIIFVYLYIKFNKNKFHVIEYFTLPFISVRKSINVVTIHDLRKIYFSELFIINLIFKLIYKILLSTADKIIAVSETAKNELQRYFNFKNIIVSYNAISEEYHKKVNSSELLKIKKKYKLPKKFIISVGHLEKRKNFLRLIDAVKILKDNNININLIIVGQKSDQFEKIIRRVKKFNLKSNIKIFSKVDDYELLCFYKLSKLFVYPSLYEGFGIPTLESMSTNLPIVLSNSDIFREITSSKYCYFDPNDPLSIANKIRFVLNDPLIKKNMVRFGKKRIKKFKPSYISNKIIRSILK